MRRAVEYPSVTQTVYCGTTGARSATDDALTKTKDGGNKQEDAGRATANNPKESAGTDGGKTPPPESTKVKIKFKDLDFEAASPSAWMVGGMFLVAVGCLVAFVIVVPKEESWAGAILGLLLALAVGGGGYLLGSWLTGQSCKDVVTATVEKRGDEAIQVSYTNAATELLSSENARLRQDLADAKTELRIARAANQPAWDLPLATALFGLTLGLALGTRGFRDVILSQRDHRYRYEEEQLSKLREMMREREVGFLQEVVEEVKKRQERR